LIELHAGSATDIGRVRSSNQDVALVDDQLFAVADGMGGHVGGEVAARVAVETLRNAFSRQPTVDGLRRAVADANRAVWRQSQSDTSLRGMGTTLTAMALVRAPDGAPLIALANVGDSRAYVYSGGQLVQVTDDHSLAEEKVRQGELTEAEAAVHPHRHILTRALGVASDVDVDLWELRLQDGDRILLCSDGLTNEVGDDRIGTVLAGTPDPSAAAAELVRIGLDSGGNDNITVVVVDIVGEEEAPIPVPVVTSVTPPPPPVVAEPVTTVVAVTPPPPPPPPSFTQSPDAGHATSAVPVVVAGAAGAASTVGFAATTTGAASPGRASAPSGPRRVGGSAGDGSRLLTTGRGGPAAFDPDQPPPTRREKRRARRRAGIPRLVTLRVLIFLILLGGVVYGAYYLVRWYANDDWYVAASNTHLVVFHGRPGGFLWYKPSIEEACNVTTSQIPTYLVKTVTKRVVEKPSLAAAASYITNLYQQYLSTQQTSTGQTPNPPATTTTTAPRTTTTSTTTATTTTSSTAPTTTTTTAPTGPTTPANPAVCKLVTPTNTSTTVTTTTSAPTTAATTTTPTTGAG
jgi:serine/threonine protein phosphatase PrpC